MWEEKPKSVRRRGEEASVERDGTIKTGRVGNRMHMGRKRERERLGAGEEGFHLAGLD